ncbi:MAG: GNAT family N-acetyltransferase [Candidatus Gracilibacteria bacterium]|nr:GNAT family N-acetyltransferase [Candidatus Gracilibacteria bacterium]
MLLITEPDPDDAGEIFFVQRQTWHESYTHEISHEEIEHRFADAPERIEAMKERIAEENPEEKFFVAREPDTAKIVGFISMTKQPENEIRSLYVLDRYKSRGIGSQLIKEGFRWFGNEEIVVHVSTEPENKPVLRFYRKKGFRPIRSLPSEECAPFEMMEMRRKPQK